MAEKYTVDNPLFDSDVDPKRIRDVADGLRRQGEAESARMLYTYANLLAAREGARPVAEMVYFSRTSPLTSSFDRITVEPGTAHQHVRAELIHHIVPLFDHPPAPNADRLAEALRECADDLEVEIESRRAGELPRRIDRDLSAVRRARAILAAHSAGAQPVSAKVDAPSLSFPAGMALQNMHAARSRSKGNGFTANCSDFDLLRDEVIRILAAGTKAQPPAQPSVPGVIHTHIGHHAADSCRGCWNINKATFLATCYECGEERDVAAFLGSAWPDAGDAREGAK